MTRTGPRILFFGPLALLALLAVDWGVFVEFFNKAYSLVLLMSDLSRNEVASMQGRVSFSTESVAGPSTQRAAWYVVGGFYFPVTNPAAEYLLPRRGQCKIYFTPRSRLMLSIEPVGDAKVLTSLPEEYP